MAKSRVRVTVPPPVKDVAPSVEHSDKAGGEVQEDKLAQNLAENRSEAVSGSRLKA